MSMDAIAMDWRSEMNKMLVALERQTIQTLGNIKMAFNGQSFKPTFKEYFLRACNIRMAETFEQFEMNARLEEEMFGRVNANASSDRGTVSASINSTCVKTESENETNNLIEIDDSSDEEVSNGRTHTSKQAVQRVTTMMISSMDSSLAKTLSHGAQLEQSGASTIKASGCNEFRIGSTMIRGCQSIARNGTVTNDEETFVGLDTDASDESTQQSHGCAAANSVQKSNAVDVGRGNGTMLGRNGKRSMNSEVRRDANMSKEVQTNPSTRSAHTRPISSKKIATVTANSSQRVVGSLKTNRFKCQICGYVYLHMGHLNTHTRKHTGERPYRCNRCGKGFSQAINLKAHVVTHTDIYPFHCKGCLRQFSQKAEKVAHEKECTVRRYECHLCKMFVHFDKAQLKVHMRKHTGEKPFRCEICMARFSQKESLRRHLKNVHVKTH